ncbi:Uncharacterized protein C19orf52 [Trichoplax sp. H2]|uniref:Uncharacterized protein n=1 Tax=Trichoplax adhaerens TaxID=10228 RepID=B3S0Q3_TRIAD|nr:hypothetical protein TRIADDRAFT_57134 [Trichoplax adhaerens]EDV24046.1 hypothetical protein TRIADDRAFT_57134 [Trichoplax adhaerens]RDD44886.1 Uncharacterized protein C19orf52 [Trichoplax sp. H2]|eukprot:XP_002113572.1 hypothetical protein TRIADDRAFT_57134 [Trichoplax adhaerens]
MATRKLFTKLGNPLINIYRDYEDVFTGIAKSCYRKPSRPIFLGIFAGVFGYIWHQNPDEKSFDAELQQCGNALSLLSRLTRNPSSDAHIDRLLYLQNENLLTYVSLGLFSLVIRQDANEICKNYEYTCHNLQSGFWTYYDKIEDIGFLQKWLILDRKMIDYDVNPLVD